MRRQITYDPTRDYYVILGLDAEADDEAIRQAYRRAVREVHPDLNPDRQDWATRELQRVNEAYTILSDHNLRRDYDRVRWPHVPTHPLRQRRHSPFGKSTYDSNRPWWEQVSQVSPQGASTRTYTSPRYRSRRRRSRQQFDPLWLSVSNWLKKHNFTRLNGFWLALVGLWRSPYAGMLSILGVVLAVDVALILFVLLTPNSWDDVEHWIANRGDNPPPATVEQEPTAVPGKLNFACADPAMQITAPVIGDGVGNSFLVYGTIQHPELWTYSLAIGFIGQTANSTTPPVKWTIVRQSPTNQSIPEPAIEDALLTEKPVVLTGGPAGFYAIRLQVELRTGETRLPCDIVVRYQP